MNHQGLAVKTFPQKNLFGVRTLEEQVKVRVEFRLIISKRVDNLREISNYLP